MMIAAAEQDLAQALLLIVLWLAGAAISVLIAITVIRIGVRLGIQDAERVKEKQRKREESRQMAEMESIRRTRAAHEAADQHQRESYLAGPKEAGRVK